MQSLQIKTLNPALTVYHIAATSHPPTIPPVSFDVCISLFSFPHSSHTVFTANLRIAGSWLNSCKP